MWDASAKAASSSPKGTIRIRLTDEPSSLLSLVDPSATVRNISDHDIVETLVTISKDGKTAVPELATSWDTSEDMLTYTFHLNPQARWHDGKPVTSDDVVFTFSKLLDPDTEMPLPSVLADVNEVLVEEQFKFTVTLDRPHPSFLAALASLPIIPRHVFGLIPLAVHPAARAPIGSGPFKFKQWIPGRTIELERNPDWRGSPVYIEKIVYQIIKDDRVAIDLFKRGEIDIVGGLPGRLKPVGNNSRVVSYPLSMFQAWIYNVSKPMFARAATRTALGMLIDRRAVRCSILGCKADLIESPWPRELLPKAYAPRELKFNPQRAGQLLSAEGWLDKDGDGVRERGGVDFSFYLLLPDIDVNLQRTAAVVRSDFAAAGIEMHITTASFETYLESLRNHRFDASVIAVSNSTLFDPVPLFHSRFADGGRNFGSFGSAKLDALMDKMADAKTSNELSVLMREITSVLRKEQPMTFTFRPHASALIKNSVQGVVIRNGWFEERFLWLSPSASGAAQ